jgi:UDP-GlcNAc:undecaprenyl-phosphate GlcNAc-1-phosphate transferase
MELLIAGVVAALVTAVLAGLAVWAAPRLGFVDRPGAEAHKQQARTVPYGGGLAMALGALAGLLLLPVLGDGGTAATSQSGFWAIAGGCGGLLLLGLYDDWRPMRARWKLLCQMLIIGISIGSSNLTVASLHPLSPILGQVMAFGWCLVISNTFNLIDHADGLAGSMALVALTAIGATAAINGEWASVGVLSVCMGTLLGFLVWNLPPARIYMGDAGSLPLGYAVAVGALDTTFWSSSDAASVSPLTLIAPFLLMALPVYDTSVVVVKRWLLRRPLFKGDRNHISHRLQRLGLSSRASLATAVALQVALAGCALQMRQQDTLTIVVILCQAAAIVLAALLLEAVRDHAR